MDDKAEAFVECLLGDIFGCFTEAMKLDIEFGTDEQENRLVPEEFYCEIISFSKYFVDKLLPEISRMPVLLCYCEDFFKRFATSVCLRLIKGDDPEVAFLKVMAFLLAVTASSFVNRCYRFLDNIPGILNKLLKEHLKTKFYEENGFDAILLQIDELKEDEEWHESTVGEMHCHMIEALSTELAATTMPHNDFQPDRSKIRMIDARSQSKRLVTDSKFCPYCDTECIFFLKVFWKPKIVYKPECQQM